jgi:thiol:disulfide interchange protein DsbA
MRCSDIDAIIDDHRVSALTAAKKTEVAAHLEECRRCSGAWLTNEALLGEQLASVPAGTFSSTARRVRARIAEETARTARPWPAAAGIAALLLLVFAFAARQAMELAPTTASDGPAASGEPSRVLSEGRDYRVLPQPAGVPASGPIEVVHLFAYDCEPCFAVERQLSAWRARPGADIDLVRIPVQWNARGRLHARAFFAADALGKAEDMRLALYEEIHGNGNALDTDEALASLFERFGVDRETFARVFASPGVEARAGRTRDLAAAYRVNGVPTVIVGGEYFTTGAMTGSAERLVKVVDELVECVENERRGAAPSGHC